MNRFSTFLLLSCQAAIWALVGVDTGRAQVVIGPETGKIDWPTVSYAAIDVSGDVQGDNAVSQVLLGEDGKVVFVYASFFEEDDTDPSADADPGDDQDVESQSANLQAIKSFTGFNLHVCAWQNGSVFSNQATPFRTSETLHVSARTDPETGEHIGA